MISETVAFQVLQASLPPTIYWAPLALALFGMIGIVYLLSPPVTDWTVAAMAPWAAIGAVLHVLSQQQGFPGSLKTFFDVPMIFLVTALMVVGVWTLSELVVEMRPPGASTDRQMGALGIALLLVVTGLSLALGTRYGTLRPLWPVLGFFFACVITGLVWVLMGLVFSDSAVSAGNTGVVVLFGHIVDGASVLVGADLLSVSLQNQSVLTRVIMEVGSTLPIGAGATYLLAKVALAIAVLVAFKRILDEVPTAGRIGLGIVAAAGLAIGLHNILLFTVIQSVPGMG